MSDQHSDDESGSPLPDQRAHWERLRAGQTAPQKRRGPTAFGQRCAALFPPGGVVLELGCGSGKDSAYFASRGHLALATDFSPSALRFARDVYGADPGFHAVQLSIADPLPLRDGAVSVAFANLSLHYFPDALTRRIFAELHRVLTPGGLLCFACKTPADPLHGQGREIEPDMFERDGHLRHFFSADYARSLLAPGFVLADLREFSGERFDMESGFVEVLATRTGKTI